MTTNDVKAVQREAGARRDERVFKTLRPEVRRFAIQMELVLRQNDHKGGWQEMSPFEILYRITEELREVQSELEEPVDAGSVMKEAIDVANFLMFLVDVTGGFDD